MIMIAVEINLIMFPFLFKASRAGVIYQCIDCREIFRDKASCQVHAAAGCVAVQSKEPANRIKGGLLYECPVCHKTFSVFSKMIEHLPVHTKPFLCQLCGQRFAQADLFAEHKSTCTAGKSSIRSFVFTKEDGVFVSYFFYSMLFLCYLFLKKFCHFYIPYSSLVEPILSISQVLENGQKCPEGSRFLCVFESNLCNVKQIF